MTAVENGFGPNLFRLSNRLFPTAGQAGDFSGSFLPYLVLEVLVGLIDDVGG